MICSGLIHTLIRLGSPIIEREEGAKWNSSLSFVRLSLFLSLSLCLSRYLFNRQCFNRFLRPRALGNAAIAFGWTELGDRNYATRKRVKHV